MAVYDYSNLERAEAYRILADFFIAAPDENMLRSLKEDFELESEETADEIRRDFDRLFPYPEGKIPPIESFFLTLENTATAQEVSAYYAGAGLAIEDEFELIPDHLYLELLFMSYLIETNRFDLQKKFLDEHLMNWVPYYCDELIRQAKTVFYREIAEITRDFLISESEEEFK
ncbi:MAG: molecular chaperone TorD family protein [Nitrospirota bacterium]|nr:molecular chaperone TorD family protein [Nitrospirota bacterium]